MVTIFMYVAYATAFMLMIMSVYFANLRTKWPIFHYWFNAPFAKRTPLLIHRISWIISLASIEVAVVLRSLELGYNVWTTIFASLSILFAWWLVIILFCWGCYILHFFIRNPMYCLKPIEKWFTTEKETEK